MINLIEMIQQVTDYSTVYILVDALDECPDGLDSERGHILTALQRLRELGCIHLRICVTSRPENDIEAAFESLASHRVSVHAQLGQQQDIASYVRSVVNTYPNWREKDRLLVIDTLSWKADGMCVNLGF